MGFQNQLGQTKVFLITKEKISTKFIAFSRENFIFKIEIACNKKLKWDVAMNLKPPEKLLFQT
jgi:hypothetical protein